MELCILESSKTWSNVVLVEGYSFKIYNNSTLDYWKRKLEVVEEFAMNQTDISNGTVKE